MSKLQRAALGILGRNPNGLDHVGLVKALLNSGYQHKTNTLSEDLMREVKLLVKHGEIYKDLGKHRWLADEASQQSFFLTDAQTPHGYKETANESWTFCLCNTEHLRQNPVAEQIPAHRLVFCRSCPQPTNAARKG